MSNLNTAINDYEVHTIRNDQKQGSTNETNVIANAIIPELQHDERCTTDDDSNDDNDDDHNDLQKRTKQQEHNDDNDDDDDDDDDVGISLYMQGDDDANLSQFQIIVRQQLEFFTATQRDVVCTKQGRKKKVQIGQVGIRCALCNSVPLQHRGAGAVYYPRQLNGIYQAAQSMALSHLCVSCTQIEPTIRVRLFQLRAKNRHNPANRGKDYWIEKCIEIGLYEKDGAIFLSTE